VIPSLYGTPEYVHICAVEAGGGVIDWFRILLVKDDVAEKFQFVPAFATSAVESPTPPTEKIRLSAMAISVAPETNFATNLYSPFSIEHSDVH
jgi:hypothetical protein